MPPKERLVITQAIQAAKRAYTFFSRGFVCRRCSGGHILGYLLVEMVRLFQAQSRHQPTFPDVRDVPEAVIDSTSIDVRRADSKGSNRQLSPEGLRSLALSRHACHVTVGVKLYAISALFDGRHAA